MNAPVLKLTELKVHFSVRKGLFRSFPVKAVDGVSLEVGRGETVAVVGESGSGKTTLGRAILRLVPITGGKVEFDGIDVASLDSDALKAYRRRAQVVFQDPYSSNSPFMTVFEQLEEPLLVHGIGTPPERTEIVHRALEMVRLTPAAEFTDKYAHTMSGGQRQRVCIARSVVLEPEFIVADEPVSMIDASSRAEILSILRDLQTSHGIAFLYITHDIASARHFSDRTVVMYAGTMVEIGRSGELIDEPLHPYTKGLIAAVPEPDPANRKRIRPVVAGEPPSAAAVPSGCPFHPRCPVAIAGRCETVRPVLREVRPGRFTACHLYDENRPSSTI
ncbi:MAG: ABC transporter ATP-binding protein [Spirochaetaceae bacterium]|nr:MAG: ABC transporter ATP-binding protein [Spirochaetaceae bacterium]